MIIGLNGFKGSGKTVAATYLAEKHGFHHAEFSEKMYYSVAQLFGIEEGWNEILNTLKNHPYVRVELTVNKKTISSMDFRTFLQRYGTEAHRHALDEDLWINVLWKSLEGIEGDIVIGGVRFPNEIESIKDRGGRLVRIDRPGIESDGHSSEIRPPDGLFDEIITNNGTLEDLYFTLDNIVNAKDRNDTHAVSAG